MNRRVVAQIYKDGCKECAINTGADTGREAWAIEAVGVAGNNWGFGGRGKL